MNETKVIGPEIVQLKGYTSAGVSLAACRLIGAIVRNERCVVPVSTVLRGQYGIDDVISRVIELTLDEEGRRDLEVCHAHLRELLESVGA